MSPLSVPIVVEGVKPLTIVAVEDHLTWLAERVMVLTGARTRPDTLAVTAYVPIVPNDYLCSCQGLWRGRYADALVSALDLIKALTPVAPKKAKELQRMLDAWLNPSINRKNV